MQQVARIVAVFVLALQGTVLGSSICARIVDPGGLPLPSALMTIVNLEDPKERFWIRADSGGVACREKLEEGLYSVEASFEGFMNVRYYPVTVTFPHDVKLNFQLPIGAVFSGLPARPSPGESLVSGTLRHSGEPVSFVRICLYRAGHTEPAACTKVNELGQYALAVPPEIYRVEIISRSGKLMQSKSLDLSKPGFYRNRIRLRELK